MEFEILFTIAVILSAVVGLFFAYRLFAPPAKGLRILMYHKLNITKADILTVTVAEFSKQIHYLTEEGYTFLTFQDLINAHASFSLLPRKAVVLTFDDGYQNNFEYLLPILKQQGIKATVFLPIDLIGKENEWDGGGEKLMDWETLKKAASHFEYGMHSFRHQSMAQMTEVEFRQDIESCLETLHRHDLPFIPVLSYPYGRFPKDRRTREAFERILDEFAIQFAVRIGNKINGWPIKNQYLTTRIDVRGTDSIERFKKKIALGKVNLF